MGFWPDSLVREVAERRVIFFVGAGLSKSAHPSLPTWSDLLLGLSKRLPTQVERRLVGKLIGRGSMLDAAQVIRDRANRADIAAEVRATFQVRPIPYHAAYRDLLLMDPKTIVTTNYDEFLEKSFEYFSGGNEAHSISRHDSKHLLNDLRSPIRSIVKLHGCVNNPAEVVLDRSSYFDARRNNPGLFSIVASLMTVNTVLFLGYSMGDPDIQLILENIHLNSASDNSHYALMPKLEHRSLKQSIKHTYNVDILEYGAGEHSLVSTLINELAAEVEKLRSARGIV